LEKAEQFPDADRHRQNQVAPFVDRTNGISGNILSDLHRATYRWAVEEFRISMFAQELGTAMPVSAARLEKLWASSSGTRASTMPEMR